MNEASIIDILTIGMVMAAVMMIALGLRETFRRMKQVEQLATLPPQSPPPDEALPPEVFAEIVAGQVSDILSVCHWYDSTWKDGVE